MIPTSRRVRVLGQGGALLALAALGSPLAAQRVERYALRGDRAAVYNLAGEVRVEAGSGPDVAVEVTRGGADAGRLRIQQGSTRDGASLRVVTPGDRIVYPRMGRFSNSTFTVRDDGSFGGGLGGHRVTVSGGGSGVEAYADLRVLVPAGRTVAIHQGVGKVEIANVNGNLQVHSSSASVAAAGTRGALGINVGSGSVRVERAEGDVDVDTGSGSVRVADVRGRRIKLDTGSGSVNGSGIVADVFTVDVGSGGIGLSGVRAGDVKVDTGSGSVDLGLTAPARSVDIDTGSGSVRVAVPSSFGAELDIETGSGGIRVDVPAQAVRSSRSHYHGRIGNGQGRVKIETGSGGVRVTGS